MSVKFLSFFLCSMILTSSYIHATFTLMLDPAGDAQYPGRIIDDSFERGVTLQCAEKLQHLISQDFHDVRVVLTRFPGESRQPLQNANFANRLDVDLYLSILFYPESKPKSQLYIYYFSYNDAFMIPPSRYSLCPYDKAHLLSLKTTKTFSDMMADVLKSKSYASLFTFHGPYTLPFAPLMGIKKPALAIEIGLKTKDNWEQFLEPIIASITPIIAQHL